VQKPVFAPGLTSPINSPIARRPSAEGYVHHATIFEMNVESYRRRAALERKRGRGRPPTHATVTANA